MKESKPLTYCKCMCTCKEPNIFGVSETAQTKDTSTTKNVKEPVCSLIAGWLTVSPKEIRNHGNGDIVVQCSYLTSYIMIKVRTGFLFVGSVLV